MHVFQPREIAFDTHSIADLVSLPSRHRVNETIIL